MATIAYLDTHLVAWLYAGHTDTLPGQVQLRLARDSLLVSPMVTLELRSLHEIGRLSEGPKVVLPALQGSLGLKVCDRSFADVATYAWSVDWTRDPFDRIITAQAAIGGNILITKDGTIAANYPHAIWS